MKKSEIPVGSKIYFVLEKRPYRVRAKSKDGGFLVCTKPFNLQHTVLYCILDTKEEIRGTEGVVFCMGAESDQDCREMIGRLERGETTISYKNQIPAIIPRVDLPKVKHEEKWIEEEMDRDAYEAEGN